MTQTFEMQPERTDLPLVVAPSILEFLIEPLKEHLSALQDVARVRLYEDYTSDDDVIAERLRDADIMLVGGNHISDNLLQRMSGEGHVKCVVFCGTGVASYINLDMAKQLGVRVCNAEHYGDNAVAEHTFALMFELLRKVGSLNTAVHAGHWGNNDDSDGKQLAGRSLGIIGLGGIGATVARIAGAFGMTVRAWNSHVPQRLFDESGATPVDDMNELIEKSDIVSVHMPLSEATRGIITAENLSHLQPGSMIINTARAEVIESGALLARLQQGDVLAGLDVFDTEPLAADDPLCALDGVVLTPHVGWRTDGAAKDLTRQMVECTLAYCQGRDFNVVVHE